jgi:NADH-quinone oxidoreductase subunit H
MNAAKRASAAGILRRLFVEAQSGLGSVFGVWFIGPLLPLALLFLLSILAETNRAPFDLPEAEAEIVAGYNVEYSGILFALFFLAEYANMLLMSALFVIFFLAGWASPSWMFLAPGFYFALKIGFVSVFYILVRAALPRVRYDQLMCIGWKRLLPLALGHLLASSSFLFCDEGLWRLEFDQLEHRSVAYSSVFTPF